MKKNSVFTGNAGKRARFLPVILTAMILAAAMLLSACGQSAPGNDVQGSAAASPEQAPAPAPAAADTPAPEESSVSAYAGEWVDVISGFNTPGQPVRYVFSGNGSYVRGESTGTLDIAGEGKEIWLDRQRPFLVVEEDGFTALACFREPYGTEELLVRAEDYEAYVDHYFLIAEITAENLREYMAEPAFLANPLDAWGEPDTSTEVLYSESLLYREGFTYIAKSEDFKFEVFRNTLRDQKIVRSDPVTWVTPFGMYLSTPGSIIYSLGERAMGSLVYIRPGFVRSNTVGDYFRRVEMTSGVVFASVETAWHDYEEYYPDHMY